MYNDSQDSRTCVFRTTTYSINSQNNSLAYEIDQEWIFIFAYMELWTMRPAVLSQPITSYQKCTVFLALGKYFQENTFPKFMKFL